MLFYILFHRRLKQRPSASVLYFLLSCCMIRVSLHTSQCPPRRCRSNMDVIRNGLAMYWNFTRAVVNHKMRTSLIAMWIAAVLTEAFRTGLICLVLSFPHGCSSFGLHRALSLWCAQNLPRTMRRLHLWRSPISDQYLQSYSFMDLLLGQAAWYLFCFLAVILNNRIVRGLLRHRIPLDLGLKVSLILCWWTTLIGWGLPALRYAMNQPDWSDKVMAVLDLTTEQCLMWIMSWFLICFIATVAEIRVGQLMERLILH